MPELDAVVSNTRPWTTSRILHSSRTVKQAATCSFPVPLPILGTASSFSIPLTVTITAIRSTSVLEIMFFTDFLSFVFVVLRDSSTEDGTVKSMSSWTSRFQIQIGMKRFLGPQLSHHVLLAAVTV